LAIGPLVTGVGHVGQQHLQHHGLALAGARAVGLHLHAGADGAAAARSQRALALDLDHAGPAIAVRAITLLVAEVGNLDPGATGRLEDGFTLKSLQRPVVQRELHRGRFDVQGSGRRVHHRIS